MPEPVTSIAIGSATFALILSLVQSASLYFNPPHTIQYDYDYDLERIDLDHKIDVDIPDPGLDLSFSLYGRTSRRHSLTPTMDFELNLDLDRADHMSDQQQQPDTFDALYEVWPLSEIGVFGTYTGNIVIGHVQSTLYPRPLPAGR
ncbi:hypothetical protein BG003_011459 [Podila horticola]|nr:hypothetical protein BG003_011459 [Podila horticola]